MALYWLITYHPVPPDPTIDGRTVAVLIPDFQENRVDIFQAEDAEKIARNDIDAIFIEDLSNYIQSSASEEGAEAFIERLMDTLSHVFRIDGPFEQQDRSISQLLHSRHHTRG